MENCMYCRSNLCIDDGDVYKCRGCGSYVHLSCTKCTKPSRLEGDCLFQFQCKVCSVNKTDCIGRMKLGWVQIIHLALYNLTILESGRQGFFRWKEEICTFIEQNWMNLMPGRTKTNTWSSTVAGNLSVHTPKLFKSGLSVFNETGWWALQGVNPPFRDLEMYKTLKSLPVVEPPGKKAEMKLHGDSLLYGRGKRQKREKKVDDHLLIPNKIPKLNSDKGRAQYASELPEARKVHQNIPKFKIKIDNFSHEKTMTTVSAPHVSINSPKTSPTLITNIKSEPIDYDSNEWKQSIACLPTSEVSLDFEGIQFSDDAINFSNMDFSSTEDPFPLFEDTISSLPSMLAEESNNLDSNNAEEGGAKKPGTSDVVKREVVETPTPEAELEQKSIVAMTAKEELELLTKIGNHTHVMECDASVRRLYRKLLLRKLKREIGLNVFNLDVTVNNLTRKTAPDSMKFLFGNECCAVPPVDKACATNPVDDKSYYHPALRGVNVLDRFECARNFKVSSKHRKTTLVGMIGNTNDYCYTRSITSPYTSRVLKPYIRRDFDALPPKLQVLKNIQDLRSPNGFKRWPIDYCYVQPNHIPAVNALCSDFFWPGIDVTECLHYPEFSCVVLYRRLLIGFAFMVPDVSYNEAYISFILVHPDWQRAGIATNMIYHLIQTCMGKDITLHVSPSNPSMMLYQKFGFKAEELILDFYKKYLPEDSNACKHAFLLRLQR